MVEAIGETPAFIVFFRNCDVIPDPPTARAILGMKAAEPLTSKQTQAILPNLRQGATFRS
jgi:hypothetical protein